MFTLFTFETSEDTYSQIKSEIENLSSKIENNFVKYLKYNKIIKNIIDLIYTLFTSINNEKDKNNDLKIKSLKDIIEGHETLFIKKISQDISFYLGLITENKNFIENLLKQDIFYSIENKESINEFIEENKITIDIKDALNKFLFVLKENNNKMKLSEDEINENLSQGEKMDDEVDEDDNDIHDSLLDLNQIEKIRAQNDIMKNGSNIYKEQNINCNEISQ